MTERRFHAGDTFEIPPMQFRVVHGAKGPDDLRLDWRWTTDWQPVTLDQVFLIVDMIHENENLLYPLPAAGGGKVLSAIRDAARYGWRKARHDLHLERARKRGETAA